jgi:dienelactone hydrolase
MAALAGACLAAAGLAACGTPASGARSTTSTTSTTSTSTVTTTTPPTTTSTTTTTTLPPTTTTTLPPSFAVGVVDQTFVNPAGVAVDYATGGTMPRTLLTEIRYPTLTTAPGTDEVAGATPARSYGPFPLVVFAHGYDVVPDNYETLLDAWVRAGFVVLAPLFPDENSREVQALGGPYSRPGSEAEQDLYEEPSDLSFLVDTVVKLAGHASAGPTSVLDGLVDPNELVLAGQSDGAEAVAALEFDSAYSADFAAMAVHPRVVAVLSGAELGPSYDYRAPPAPPLLLVVQSATDQCNVPQASTALYDALPYPASAAKWFLELDDSTHLGPYDSDSGAGQVVQATTTHLFELGLGLHGPPAGAIVADVHLSGQAALTTGAAAPAIQPLPVLAEACSPPVASAG